MDPYGGACPNALVAWAAAWCVGYQEDFISGDRNEGAYVYQIRIAAPVIQMLAGGPSSHVAPAAGEPADPPLALVANPFAVAVAAATATAVEEVIEEFVVPAFEQIVAAGLKALGESIVAGAAAAAPPVALTLALILASSTPAGGPGIPQPHGLPVDPNVLRLNTLAARHAAGTLTADEEEELVALLGKVKGIHVQKLSDLTDLYPIHEFNGHHINLRSCPIIIPPSASITEQAKSGYDQVKFKWTRGPYGYEARWHTRTPGAPAIQGDTWVITRTTPGTAQGQRKTQHILTGPNQWTPVSQWQSAVSANQAGTASETQKLLLNNGHWNASN